MNTSRRILLLLATVFPLAAHAACASSNGEPIPSQVFDASALDSGGNPDDPEDPTGDGGSKPDSAVADGSTKDAPGDSPVLPNTAPVQINELYVDQILDGDGAEFVELRAAPGTPMDDLKLRLIKSNGEVRYEVAAGLAGDKVGVSGLWVIGTSQSYKLYATPSRVDRTISVSTWGLDSPGAVQVVRGTTLLDVVGFNDEPDGGAVPATMQAPSATVEGKTALVPDNQDTTKFGTRKTFGRKEGAADTNNNAVDFCKMLATPGYPQKPCL